MKAYENRQERSGCRTKNICFYSKRKRNKRRAWAWVCVYAVVFWIKFFSTSFLLFFLSFSFKKWMIRLLNMICRTSIFFLGETPEKNRSSTFFLSLIEWKRPSTLPRPTIKRATGRSTCGCEVGGGNARSTNLKNIRWGVGARGGHNGSPWTAKQDM